MSFTIPTIFTAIDKLTAPIRKMSVGVQSFASNAEAGISRLDRGLRKLTPSLGAMGKQMLSFASVALIGTLFVSSAKSIADYETALASAQAITGASDTAFVAFRQNIESVAKSTKKSTIDVAKGFEIVGSAAPELLKNADALGAVTAAAITLSKASRDDLETSALSLTGVMNQFSVTGGAAATKTMNILAAGSVVGSANISNVSESMKNFGTVAAGANMTMEQSVALIEVMGKKSVFGAEAGTKLKGSVLKLQQAGVGYASGVFNINDALDESRKKFDSLGTAQQKDAYLLKTFGAENITTGKIMLDNIDLFNEYTKGVTGTNTAVDQAAINSNTFSNRLDELSNRWTNIITTNNAATGSLGLFKNLIVFVTDNLETIVGVIGVFIGSFIALKIAVLAGQAAIFAYNVALGVSQVMSAETAVSIGASNVAMKAQMVASYAVAAAQWVMAGGIGAAASATWVFTAALLANPITWIILAVVALGVAIGSLIYYFEDIVKWVTESDSVFAKFIRAALLPVILLFKSIGWAIDVVTAAFSSLIDWVQTSDSGFAKFIRGTLSELSNAFTLIGSGITTVIDGLSWLWDQLSKFTSDALAPLFAIIDMMSGATQKELGVNIGGAAGADGANGVGAGGGGTPLINNKVAERDGIVDKLIENKKEEVIITVNTPNGNAEVSGGSKSVAVRTSSTTNIGG